MPHFSWNRRQLLRTVGTGALAPLVWPMAAHASLPSGWPEKPVRVVVPFPAGGTTDVIARLTLQKLGELVGQSFVVDNKGGAGGIIGTDLVARAAPDGYTLLMNTAGAQTLSPVIYKTANYQALGSFEAISHICDVGFVIIARKDLPANTLDELIALARQGKSLTASSGSSMIALITEQFKRVVNAPGIVNIQYKGTAPQMQAVVAGEVDFSFDSFISTEMIRSGKVKALAVILKQRAEMFPQTPTLKELGIADMEFSSWAGLLAPKGTPTPIVEYLAEQMAKVVQMPDILARIKSYNYLPVQSSPQKFARLIAQDNARWQRIVKETGYSIEQ